MRQGLGRGPLRSFLQTETAVPRFCWSPRSAALAWANMGPGTHQAFWSTELSVRLGAREVSLGLRQWVNSGLMTLFFVVGLEARLEFDLGELRERRRVNAAAARRAQRHGRADRDLPGF